MFCETCGKRIPNNSSFCPECGLEIKHPISRISKSNKENPISKSIQSDAVKADAIYKSYFIEGISNLDKINGRLLASQTTKLDKIIEQNTELIKQNNEIINLLMKIANK